MAISRASARLNSRGRRRRGSRRSREAGRALDHRGLAIRPSVTRRCGRPCRPPRPEDTLSAISAHRGRRPLQAWSVLGTGILPVMRRNVNPADSRPSAPLLRDQRHRRGFGVRHATAGRFSSGQGLGHCSGPQEVGAGRPGQTKTPRAMRGVSSSTLGATTMPIVGAKPIALLTGSWTGRYCRQVGLKPGVTVTPRRLQTVPLAKVAVPHVPDHIAVAACAGVSRAAR